MDPTDPIRNEIDNILVMEKQLSTLMNNLKLDVMTWISRLDSDIFGYKLTLPEGKMNQINTLQKITNQQNLSCK